jgi:hypothetical protein
MHLRHCLAAFALGISTALVAHASVDPTLYQGLHWR